jgi:beta-lactamase superfamily II metal-dependent hydrolase
MNIEIFDVEHGGCALITADNSRRILIDCGHNSTTGWRPSQALSERGVRNIDLLIVSNYDEDHVSDLANLRRTVDIDTLLRNTSIASAQLQAMKKENGMGYGITALVGMIDSYTGTANPLDLGDLQRSVFWNSYPMFEDENNLSVVTILHYSDFGIIFPGDIETDGWLRLLEQQSFRNALANVNVFVASHHGRENGYCADVFKYCTPDIVVFSDSGIQYGTQETLDLYRKHVKGVRLNGIDRYVLTTRKDGVISFNKDRLNPCYVEVQKG